MQNIIQCDEMLQKKATGKGKNGFSYTGQCHIDLIIYPVKEDLITAQNQIIRIHKSALQMFHSIRYDIIIYVA